MCGRGYSFKLAFVIRLFKKGVAMTTIRVNDTTLYYEASGDGGTSLLFIHGMCGGGWGWSDQVQRLSDRFSCLTYDRRGHSRSASDVDNQGDATHAADAVALIEALELDRPILVGSSAGAVIAAELLCRYPGVSRGAVLSEPPLFSIDPAAGISLRSAIAPRIDDAIAQGGPSAAADAFFEYVCGEYWPRLSEEGKTRYRDNAPLLFATLTATASDVNLDELAAIQVPILLVSGSDTLPWAKSVMHVLAENLPMARSVELQGAGHVSYADRPQEFAEEVAAFADGL